MFAGSSGSGYNANTMHPGNGNGKWQGLVSTTNKRSAIIPYVRRRADSDNRNVVFCMNQLGGVGRKSNMFAPNADGIKDCKEHRVAVLNGMYEWGDLGSCDCTAASALALCINPNSACGSMRCALNAAMTVAFGVEGGAALTSVLKGVACGAAIGALVSAFMNDFGANHAIGACGGKALSEVITTWLCTVIMRKAKEKREELGKDPHEITTEEGEAFAAEFFTNIIKGELFDGFSQAIARSVVCGETSINICG